MIAKGGENVLKLANSDSCNTRVNFIAYELYLNFKIDFFKKELSQGSLSGAGYRSEEIC